MTEVVADEGGSVGAGMSDEEYFSSYEDVQVRKGETDREVVV